LTLQGSHLLAPKDWQDFERSTRTLMSCVLDDPQTRMHGRQGQAQSGVDVWGRRKSDGALVGVQCKLSMDEITEKELRIEVGKARAFTPPLAEFILATTALRDAKIQKVARAITIELRKAGAPLEVYVWGWEDIEEEAAQHADAVKAFDPTWNPFVARLQAELAAMHADLAARHTALADQIRALLADASARTTPSHHPRDARLLDKFTTLFTSGLRSWLKEHDFSNPVDKRFLDKVEIFAATWFGDAEREFVDPDIEQAFAKAKTAARAFIVSAVHLRWQDREMVSKTVMSEQEQRGAPWSQETTDMAANLNRLASELCRAIDDFLRVAHAKIVV
jgi:hypothetical protein